MELFIILLFWMFIVVCMFFKETKHPCASVCIYDNLIVYTMPSKRDRFEDNDHGHDDHDDAPGDAYDNIIGGTLRFKGMQLKKKYGNT